MAAALPQGRGSVPVVREDPYAAFNFLVEFVDVGILGATVQGGFSEVSGLSVEQETIAYRNGNDRLLTPRRLPGLVRYADIVLKRGITGDLTLWQWFAQSVSGKPQRASGQIKLLDEARNEVVVWKVSDAWPIKYTGPTLDSTSSAVAIEELVLAHGGIEIED
ncbi:MAG: phage tail protein [Gammaproteobacteria bacterium]|nr:phage tail protein [Gammaproteobacteria bacterium]